MNEVPSPENFPSTDSQQGTSSPSTEFAELGQAYCLALENLIVALERAKEKCSPKRVHRLRRTCRRLQSACALANELLQNKSARGVSRMAREILQATNALRDAQINRLRLESWLDNPSTPELDQFPKLTKAEKKLRRSVRSQLRRFDSKPLTKEFTSLLGQLQWKFASSANRGQLLEELRAGLAGIFSRVLERSQDTSQSTGLLQAKQIHRLRIAFKRYRYAAELGQSYFPALARRAEQFDRWQDALGEVQDLRVVKKHLKKSVPDKELRTNFSERLEFAQADALEQARAVVGQFGAISPQNSSDDSRYLS